MYKLLVCVLLISSVTVAEDIDLVSERLEVINKLKHEISEQYVLEEQIPAILSSLETLSSAETLQQAFSHQDFADVIDIKLKKFDKHFSFSWQAKKEAATKQPLESYWDRLERKNSGFNKVEILTGNVGYIDFWGFDKVNDDSTSRVAKVMAMVSEVNAIIFDVRNNGGGHPEMSQLLSSYLFKNRTHLNSIYWRYSDQVDEFWTFRKVKGKKIADIPIFILTSSKTFSAAEDFAYSLQSLKRAVIVGEVTAGGAHPMRFIDLSNGFIAGIPYGKAINPVTKTNWEWVGVQPDLVTSAQSAFDLAYYTALNTLIKTESSVAAKHEIEKKIEELTMTLYQ
ncbi:S41 family peptidase [Rheinheimera baltica]|uniref:S41 family peptidase n=1 Tax=Rheinheimera baltica TaxID=67576 RepID=UPI0004047F18|nr:S41 family peptidase [Rheinheimera baltica]